MNYIGYSFVLSKILTLPMLLETGTILLLILWSIDCSSGNSYILFFLVLRSFWDFLFVMTLQGVGCMKFPNCHLSACFLPRKIIDQIWGWQAGRHFSFWTLVCLYKHERKQIYMRKQVSFWMFWQTCNLM